MSLASHFRRVVTALLVLVPLVFSADQPKIRWLLVSASHFAVLTDASREKGSEVAVRLEQMRSVCGQLLLRSKLSMPEPLDVIAFKDYAEYAQIAPQRDGKPTSAQGFFLPGQDRNYIVLNLSDEESWLAVSHQFAHVYLNYNYPPTQPWFDEGFAEYFSSLHMNDLQAQIGADPESFSEILNTQKWMPLPALFVTGADAAAESSHRNLFFAESWIVMHYLLNQEKLQQTGTYFGLALNEKVPAEHAIQQAFGMSAAQMEQAVKDYFQSLAVPKKPASPKAQPLPAGAKQFTPIGLNEVGVSIQDILLPEAQALVAEAMVRVPEHRDGALNQLNTLVDDPKTETAAAHRALAWGHLQKNEFEEAGDELKQALQLKPQDPWTHFYSAWMKYYEAQANGTLFPGLANMMIDLRIVLDWNEQIAEAYHMLAMARVEGGGVQSAVQSIQTAVRLNPRSEKYLLDMARVYMAAKKWDDAITLLERLRSSPNTQIASAAKQNLEDLPTLRKYGLLPQHVQEAPKGVAKAKPPAKPVTADDEPLPQRPALPTIDRRKVEFLRGRLVTVECIQPRVAVLTVSTGSKRVRLRTEDYKALLLIGADEFSCDWSARPVVANYKAGGKSDGDLVSLEVQ
jgi:tetratricopeptide (TPR) repeat protein